jgi:hypothetical protein
LRRPPSAKRFREVYDATAGYDYARQIGDFNGDGRGGKAILLSERRVYSRDISE